MSRYIIDAEKNACTITATKQYQEAGTTVFTPKTEEIIDADGRQAATEVALRRMI
ncbi:hypothetical protein [Methanocorpusculum vombati]|uniref:Uncharacterized protein n=1 Tax=Methanocorpusculum vombati TaxID=3002864 RepID=A0ABT4IL68_9EURY|nr:hypothetical protein [Methanocorpusculum vombati]MCZ9319587.1 hypothetical protein [Methanocorpusculum sp.]MCZ0862276.1 hypothetical protein [Methanocorpusculum vombati]MDE2519820.1 hypothetical protein [Methanocorpusculum sp.]MDE2534464.1 hypothetical protein [Methanocorpusculum sp.]MDE2545772.1 hypothetical protein [Methanocorpusculum sp.]